MLFQDARMRYTCAYVYVFSEYLPVCVRDIQMSSKCSENDIGNIKALRKIVNQILTA